MFAACACAWRLAPDGRPYGLVLADVHAAMRMLGVKDTRDCLQRILILQQAALEAWEQG